jgi:hypothetical protein
LDPFVRSGRLSSSLVPFRDKNCNTSLRIFPAFGRLPLRGCRFKLCLSGTALIFGSLSLGCGIKCGLMLGLPRSRLRLLALQGCLPS